ncbi:YdcF family protein [Gluconobacter cerinus]|uniref:YdcF family protein n=1 Tax=Gluconobacter cerinus TaxID=38307 RepID=UPI00309A46B7
MSEFNAFLKTQHDTNAVNAISAFLALDNMPQPGSPPVDLVIHAGNAILETAHAACKAAFDANCPLLFSGGIGHSTALLVETVRAENLLPEVYLKERSEAEIFGALASEVWKFPREKLILETSSTNCGENATFTKIRLRELGLELRTAILFQDPTMQLRTFVTFQKAWQEASCTTVFHSCPTFVPRLEMRDGIVTYAADLPSGLWSSERFMSLIMGEIPRLRDNENGYGPRGRGFIPHVVIPSEIETAYQHVHELLKNHENAKDRVLA